MIANLCLSNKTVTYSRVLCDVQRKHNNVRDGDNLWDMGSQYYYLDRAWIVNICVFILLFSHQISH
jgi:hypothetical protein